MTFLGIILGLMSYSASAAPCSSTELRALSEVTDQPLRLTCSPVFEQAQTISRPVWFEGDTSSGTVLDCKGGTLGRLSLTPTTSRPTVFIRSQKRADGSWNRPTGVVIRNCHVIGNIRIWGMGSDGQYDDLRRSSQSLGHVQRLNAAAPSDIHLENLTLTGQGSIPLYIGPGTSRVTLHGSRLDGHSTSTAIYLDAESADNLIIDNVISVRTEREIIAVDGSARNKIQNNTIALNGRAGVTLYRNCGERGVIRHQTPSDNVIINNVFSGAAWWRPSLVVENSRNGRRSYCDADRGFPFGSSVDDRDNASGNTILNNRRQ